MRSAVIAGGDAQPGNVMPSASAMQAVVLAMPFTEEVPTLATSRLLTAAASAASSSPARNIPQCQRQSVQAPTRLPWCEPVSKQPVTTGRSRCRRGGSASWDARVSGRASSQTFGQLALLISGEFALPSVDALDAAAKFEQVEEAGAKVSRSWIFDDALDRNPLGTTLLLNTCGRV